MTSLAWFLVGVHVAGFLAMGVDKWKAAKGRSRTPEAQLCTLAVFGAIGVWAGVFVFRHKTRKRSFQLKLALATVIWVAWTWWVFGPEGAAG